MIWRGPGRFLRLEGGGVRRVSGAVSPHHRWQGPSQHPGEIPGRAGRPRDRDAGPHRGGSLYRRVPDGRVGAVRGEAAPAAAARAGDAQLPARGGGQRQGLPGGQGRTHAGAAGAARVRRPVPGRDDRRRAQQVRDLESGALERSLPARARKLRRQRAQAERVRAMSERDTPASDAAELHRPVLRDIVLRWLTPVPPGAWIVDATVGLAGHAAALLEQAAESQLLGLDRDAATLELAARRLAPFGSRVVLRQADFRDLAREATATGVEAAHAIL